MADQITPDGATPGSERNNAKGGPHSQFKYSFLTPFWNRDLGAASGKNARIGFTAQAAPGNGAVDEGQVFIRDGEMFG